MEYSAEEQQVIESLCEELDVVGVNYVVPRGYQNLPESTPGGDIDMIVETADIEEAIKIAKDNGFAPKTKDKHNKKRLVKKGLKKPHKAAWFLLSKPWKLSKRGQGQTRSRSSYAPDYIDWRAYNGDIMLHFVNHLAYKSPHKGRIIRVHPKVEQSLFNYRRQNSLVYIPSPTDELVHLICRGIYDKGGVFPDYYIEMCESLSETVLNDNNQKERFNELLSLVFFKADTVVIEAVRSGEYNQLKNDLMSFSEY